MTETGREQKHTLRYEDHQAPEDHQAFVVVFVSVVSEREPAVSGLRGYLPVNFGLRFSRNAAVPSRLSSEA